MGNELQKRIFTSIILIPLSVFFVIKGSIIFIFFLSFSFVVSSFEWIKMSKKNETIKFFGILLSTEVRNHNIEVELPEFK